MKRIVLAVALGSVVAAATGGRVQAGAQATPPAARSLGDAALLPTDASVPGWKRVENVRVFTRADLYGYIDGGAELFFELGFDQLTLQKYRSGANDVAVEIYRMTDPAAATGVYLMKCGTEARDPAFKARHTVNRHQLMFVRERYYVTVNNLSGTERIGPDLMRFGELVAARLAADRLPAELGLLPAQGLVPGSERLFRGPVGLQTLYTLGDGDILQLGGRTVGVAANYKDADATTTRMLVPYPDAAAAKQAFANVQRNLDKYLRPLTTTAARLVFKDYENKFGVVSLTGKQIDVRLHLPKAPQ
jgi:hypothetical protein